MLIENKKRLLIFSFYDPQGIVDKYVEYYLDLLIECVWQCVIVVNGFVNEEGKAALNKYADKLIIRENKGFDAGAHKAAMQEIGFCYIRKFDELILANDTCYGPFVSFKDIFDTMDKRSCDFWSVNFINNGIFSFLETYFLCIKNTILSDAEFEKYFIENIDEDNEDVNLVYAFFEVGLSQKLIQLGYKYSYYTKNNLTDYYKSPNYSIKKYNFPFMKRKVFRYDYFLEGNVLEALLLIQQKNYDVDLILKNAGRLYGININKDKIIKGDTQEIFFDFDVIDKETINNYIKGNEKIYIYGAGDYGKRFYAFLTAVLNADFGGFVVSDKKGGRDYFKKYKIYELSEINLSKIKLVAALGRENARQVKKILGQGSNVLYLLKSENQRSEGNK